MPSYKTHSIHGEKIFNELDKKIDLDIESIKTFCIGPDSLLISDPYIFNIQHSNKVKEYFTYLINKIKKEKLYENEEIMAFLYGQLDHYILDLTTHPYIYSKTEQTPSKNLINMHALFEMWLDDYISKKEQVKPSEYYSKKIKLEKELQELINDLYKKIYNVKDESKKYKLGIKSIQLFEEIIRKRKSKITKSLLNKLNLSSITYNNNQELILPYLNEEHEIWINPETGESSFDSFEDLWNKSIEISLETIKDVNDYIYNDKQLQNRIITDDLSYNTGLPCSKGQTFKYLKR